MSKSAATISAGMLLQSLADRTNAAYERDRKNHPQRFAGSPDGIGAEHLFVEGVARMLGCNIDFVRRIPRNELPASKVGQRLIYARADVQTFIRAKRDSGTARHIPIRAPRPLQPVATTKDVPDPAFDPVARVRNLLKQADSR